MQHKKSLQVHTVVFLGEKVMQHHLGLVYDKCDVHHGSSGLTSSSKFFILRRILTVAATRSFDLLVVERNSWSLSG